MNTAIRSEDMERYLQEMRAFAKRAGYTVSPAAPVAPPAAEEPRPQAACGGGSPAGARTPRLGIPRPRWSRSGLLTRARGRNRLRRKRRSRRASPARQPGRTTDSEPSGHKKASDREAGRFFMPVFICRRKDSCGTDRFHPPGFCR